MRDRRGRGPLRRPDERWEAAGPAGRGSRNDTCSTRMDQDYEDRYYPLGLSIKPSELWRQQGYSTYQHEPSVV